MKPTVATFSLFRSILSTAAEAAQRIGNAADAAATTTATVIGKTNSRTRQVTESRLVRTSPAHFYKIICNVSEYSDFLPYCSKSQILRHSSCRTMFDAVLTVGYPPFFTETYVSRVTMKQSSVPWTVQTKSLQSTIINSISSTWKVYPAPLLSNRNDGNNVALPLSTPRQGGEIVQQEQCCYVELLVEMQVSDPLIISVLDQVLVQVASTQVEAFEKRAYSLLE
jgi:ribosome-associated toxin RatA of RatAB toxin-antitoxin module